MAIKFAHADYVGLKNGKSAVGMSAYISRSSMIRETTGEHIDFSAYKADEPILAQGLALPPGSAKGWDAQRLWDEAENAEIARKTLRRTGEKRFKDGAQFAKHVTFALPVDKEITDAQRIEMVQRYVQLEYTDKNIPCQWAIHMADGNPHLHVLAATRRLGKNGFEKTKARDLNPTVRKGKVVEEDFVAQKWADFQNAYFLEQGLDLRVDPTAPVPQQHEGAAARRAEDSFKMAENATRLDESCKLARNPEAMLDHITDKQTMFTVRDVNRTLKKAGIEESDERETLINQILAHDECIALYDQAGQATGLYTTQLVREEEGAILECAKGIMAGTGGGTSQVSRDKALTGKTLDPEQAEAFAVMTGNNRLCVIQGRAGTGKSFTMGAAREVYEADGLRVIGLAPTNAVARDMKKDGFAEAATLHAELFRQEKAWERRALEDAKKLWDMNTVVMVDEAAMMDNTITLRLLVHAKRTGAKLVLIGDNAQLASVQRGGMYSEVKELAEHALISKVRRQAADWMKQASMDLADGKIGEAVNAYHEHGCIIPSREPTKDLLAQWKQDIMANPDVNRFVYAGTNAEVNQINEACAQVMREIGKVRDSIKYDCTKGDLKFTQTIGVGDRIQINATAKLINSNLINGSFGRVISATSDQVEVEMDDGSFAKWNPAEFSGFALGYAGTVYKGQGKTQMDVYALHGPLWDTRTTYVGATRHKGDFKLYVDSTKITKLSQLIRSMSRTKTSGSTQHYLDAEQAAATHKATMQAWYEKLDHKTKRAWKLFRESQKRFWQIFKEESAINLYALCALRMRAHSIDSERIKFCLQQEMPIETVEDIIRWAYSRKGNAKLHEMRRRKFIELDVERRRHGMQSATEVASYSNKRDQTRLEAIKADLAPIFDGKTCVSMSDILRELTARGYRLQRTSEMSAAVIVDDRMAIRCSEIGLDLYELDAKFGEGQFYEDHSDRIVGEGVLALEDNLGLAKSLWASDVYPEAVVMDNQPVKPEAGHGQEAHGQGNATGTVDGGPDHLPGDEQEKYHQVLRM
jgi:Ti-type conjugative transfer relaxase TraA